MKSLIAEMRTRPGYIPNLLVQGTTVFVVGGSSGIGLACAHVFATKGNDVAIFGRNHAKLNRAIEDLRSTHRDVAFAGFTMDATRSVEVEQSFENAVQELGQPGVIVCSAGDTRPGYFEDIDVDVHDDLMRLNYFGTLNCVQAVRPYLPKGASVVMVSSALALHGVVGYSAYAPSKFAVRGLAEVLRPELLAQNVFVTLALPPDTLTTQLERERPLRPRATQVFSGLAPALPAEAVAANIYRAVKARRFLAMPTWPLWLLYLFEGFAAPILRFYQTRLVRRDRS